MPRLVVAGHQYVQRQVLFRELDRVLCCRQTMSANGRRNDRIVEGGNHRPRRRDGLLNNRQGERNVVTRLIVPDLSYPDAIVIH